MRIVSSALIIVASLLAATATSLVAAPAALDKPVHVEVTLKPTGTESHARDQKVIGELVQYDDNTLKIHTRAGDRIIKWINLTPTSAFDARKSAVNPHDA